MINIIVCLHESASLTGCVHRAACCPHPNRGTGRKRQMDRAVADAAVALRRDAGAMDDECRRRRLPGYPFPSDPHPCDAGRVAAADDVAKNGGGDDGDGVTGDPVVRECRSRASAQK